MSRAIELADKADMLVEGTTPEPWVQGNHDDLDHDIYGEEDMLYSVASGFDRPEPLLDNRCCISLKDARFIARSRTLVPEMAAELRKADQCIAALEADVARGRDIVRLALEDDERVRTALARATGRKVENTEDTLDTIVAMVTDALRKGATH